MFRFEKLEVWQEANDYTDLLYKITKKFPKDELFGLSDQLRRSSSSIAANIAEGSATRSTKDFNHYLEIAIKSTYETVSHIFLAKRNFYITQGEFTSLYDKAELLVKRIRAFQNSLRSQP